MSSPDLQTIKYPKKFEELCDQLIVAEYPKAIPIEGAGGDKGVDCYLDKKSLTIFQIKYFPNRLTSSHRTQIKKSLDKASCSFSPKKWVLVIPRNLTINELGYIKDLEQEKMIPIEIWSEAKIQNLLVKHSDIAVVYFPESFMPKAISTFGDMVAKTEREQVLNYLNILKKIWDGNNSLDNKITLSRNLYKKNKSRLPDKKELQLIYPIVKFDLIYVEPDICNVRCEMDQLNISDIDIISETYQFSGVVPMKDDDVAFRCYQLNPSKKKLLWNYVESTDTSKLVEYCFYPLKPGKLQTILVNYSWKFPTPIDGLRWNEFVIDCFIQKLIIDISFPKPWVPYQERAFERTDTDSQQMKGVKTINHQNETVVHSEINMLKYNPFSMVSYYLNVILMQRNCDGI